MTPTPPPSARVAAVLVAAVLAAGCAARAPAASPTPDAELAIRAVELPERSAASSAAPEADPPDPPLEDGAAEAPSSVETTSDAPSSDPDAGGGATGSSPSPTTTAADTPSPTATARQPRTLASQEDVGGDHGLEGPAYADLVGVDLVDLGDRLRVVVRVAGRLPATLDEGEVMGIGVDLLRGEDGESGYQVFVDAGSDGYAAYLHTPAGFVAFPGSLALGEDRLVATLDWGAIGTPLRGQWRVFLDWSEQRLLVNAAASDRAPDRSWAVFDRS